MPKIERAEDVFESFYPPELRSRCIICRADTKHGKELCGECFRENVARACNGKETDIVEDVGSIAIGLPLWAVTFGFIWFFAP